MKREPRGRVTRRGALAGMVGLASLTASRAFARPPAPPAGVPVEIGVIAQSTTFSGTAIANAAELAVDTLNEQGGALDRPFQLTIFDDRGSASRAVTAFKRMARRDRVIAVIGCASDAIALAVEPWAARLKTPFLVSGASSDAIARQVRDDYGDFKYVFQGTPSVSSQAACVAHSAQDLLVRHLGMKRCVVLSEDAPWTVSLDASYRGLLPKAGLAILGEIRFSLRTTKFASIFKDIAVENPDVILTGMHRSGRAAVEQWAEEKVPIPLYGVNDQAALANFASATKGAADGVVAAAIAGPNSSITPKTTPFAAAYISRFGSEPPDAAYATYDMMVVLARAIERAKTTKPEALVTALEATDQIGTMGRIRFYGRKNPLVHALIYGPGLVQGVMRQWQHGALTTVWPKGFAHAALAFPSFVKLPDALHG